MATSLTDPEAAAHAEQASDGPAGAPPEPPEGAGASAVQRACANCGAPMEADQDWCLQCGAGAKGSLGTGGGPPWRSGATIFAAAAILALGAGAAAYAALSKGKARPQVHTTTVAQAAPAATTPPASATPAAPISPGTPTTVKPAVPVKPKAHVKPPKIPLIATKPVPTASTPSATTTTPSNTSSPSTGGGSPHSGESQPSAILLDTNSAATYNPYAYPVGGFGDPSLAIDGDTSTGWTAPVDPAVAPRMAEGIVIDLKTARKLSALALVTSTPGMTVQVYGANGETLPGSITDPAWVGLTPPVQEKSKHARLKLHKADKAFRFVTLWISKAPASSVGTPQAPGRVSVNELELFPAG